LRTLKGAPWGFEGELGVGLFREKESSCTIFFFVFETGNLQTMGFRLYAFMPVKRAWTWRMLTIMLETWLIIKLII